VTSEIFAISLDLRYVYKKLVKYLYGNGGRRCDVIDKGSTDTNGLTSKGQLGRKFPNNTLCELCPRIIVWGKITPVHFQLCTPRNRPNTCSCSPISMTSQKHVATFCYVFHISVYGEIFRSISRVSNMCMQFFHIEWMVY
jgi:hypothetical protein